MNQCRIQRCLVILILAVLAIFVSFAYAEKKIPSPIVTNGSAPANPNWDLKAQQQGDQSHDPAIQKDEWDVPNPNDAAIAQSPEGGLAVGDDCSNPISISLPAQLPYSDLSQTTCGRLNNYDATCLGNYDGGEDIIYKVDVTTSTMINITLNPKGTTYTGFLVDDACPPDPSTCIAKSTNSSSTAHTIKNLTLAPGTYYIMVDTWPSPACIPSFDLSIIASPPPPVNDNCASATPIGDVSGLAFSTLYASIDGPGGFIYSPNIWYCYTASLTGVATATLCGSMFDTKIRVWNGCTCPPTSLLAQNDDGCSGYPTGNTYASKLSFDVIAGQTYLIEVGGYSPSQMGDGTMTITSIVPPIGDACAVPIVVGMSPSALPFTIANQYTCGRSDNYNSTCLGSYDGGEDIIYRIDVTQPTYVDVTLNPKGTSYTGFLIDDACPPDPTTCLYVKTNSGSAAYGLTNVFLAVGSYYLMVDTYPSPACVPDFDLTFSVPVGAPMNDNCATATAIGNVTDLAFSTASATFDGPGGYIVSPNVWYLYTAPCTGSVDISLCNSNFDTKMRVWNGSTCPPTTVAAQDDDGCNTPNGLASMVSFATVAGSQYLIEIGGYGQATGNGFLTTNCTPAPPNDNCQDVVPVDLFAGSPLTFTGDNRGSTNDCSLLLRAQAWHAFTITECMNVTIDFCSTTPAFGSVYVVVMQGCPCGSYTYGSYDWAACGDGNVTMTYSALMPGTYYIPVLLDPALNAAGPYTIHVNASSVASMCSAGATTCDEYISNVQVGTIDNSSSCGTGGYTDYTSISTEMIKGVGYPITVTNGLPYSQDACGIWVDWNGDFCIDAGEQVAVSGNPGGGPYTAVINPPCNIATGPKLLRIRILYYSVPTPCGLSEYGEVEDYTINLVDPPAVPPTAVAIPDPQFVYYEYAVDPVTDSFYIGNFAGGHTFADINLESVKVNGLTPANVTVLPSYPGFYCPVVCATMPCAAFLAPLGVLYDTTSHTYHVSWAYNDATRDSIAGTVTLIGHTSASPGQFIAPAGIVVVPGDFDLSGQIDISDPVAMIGYIFNSQPGPQNLSIGDVNCSGGFDISDVVYMIQYIFSGGSTLCNAGK